MAGIYKSAPISELICGVILHNDLLVKHGIIFELLSELKSEYPYYTTQPQLFEEELNQNQVFTNVNPALSGFSLHRLISADQRFLVQLQHNVILVNWVRNDNQKVGAYPGFQEVYAKFISILKKVIEKLSKYAPDVDFFRNVKSYTLHYQDRVFFESYISDLSMLQSVINLNTPVIVGTDGNNNVANNIFSKFTVPVKELNGYSIISANTGTLPTGQRVLIVECRLKGKLEGEPIDLWFKRAHDLQIQFFESFFNPKILESWKQPQ